MNFYELVIIVRPDLSTSEVDNIVDNITSIVAESHEGELIKNEYWHYSSSGQSGKVWRNIKGTVTSAGWYIVYKPCG